MEGAPGLGIFPAKTQLWDELFHYICQLIAQECFFFFQSSPTVITFVYYFTVWTSYET